MWGQEDIFTNFKRDKGIIPTRVGTSKAILALFALKRDHPHACGDKQALVIKCFTPLGSSPRVWGQVAVKIREKHGLGIIPTRVGTSLREQICSRID